MTNTSRILFVDDDASVLDGLKRVLRKSDFQVVTAQSGEAALTLLEQQEADVLVADYNMPGMSGTELLIQVREKYPHMIRIMLTGGASLDAALSATFGGWVYQYLEKPVKTEELISIIEEALYIRKLQSVSPPAHLIFSSDAHRAILSQTRITASPERPTFIADSSMLEWARQLCDGDQLPPELDRIRPLVHALSEIDRIAMVAGDNRDPSETLAQIRTMMAEIT